MGRAYNLHHRRNQLNELKRVAANRKGTAWPSADELLHRLREHLGPLPEEVCREVAAVLTRAKRGQPATAGNGATVTRKPRARE